MEFSMSNTVLHGCHIVNLITLLSFKPRQEMNRRFKESNRVHADLASISPANRGDRQIHMPTETPTIYSISVWSEPLQITAMNTPTINVVSSPPPPRHQPLYLVLRVLSSPSAHIVRRSPRFLSSRMRYKAAGGKKGPFHRVSQLSMPVDAGCLEVIPSDPSEWASEAVGKHRGSLHPIHMMRHRRGILKGGPRFTSKCFSTAWKISNGVFWVSFPPRLRPNLSNIVQGASKSFNFQRKDCAASF
jgi:hypothetical protein